MSSTTNSCVDSCLDIAIKVKMLAGETQKEQGSLTTKSFWLPRRLQGSERDDSVAGTIVQEEQIR